MVVDPIADMLTQIRNAQMATKETVEFPASKIKKEVARILKNEGFINDYEESLSPKNFKNLKITLKYQGRKGVIEGLKRISKPGLRQYVSKKNTPKLLGGLGVVILSTSQGVMTGKDARRKNTGGEVLCYVW